MSTANNAENFNNNNGRKLNEDINAMANDLGNLANDAMFDKETKLQRAKRYGKKAGKFALKGGVVVVGLGAVAGAGFLIHRALSAAGATGAAEVVEEAASAAGEAAAEAVTEVAAALLRR